MDGARLRHIALLAHRYVGLALSVFLMLAGLTGTLLAFNHELDAAINPELLRVHVAPGAKPLNALQLHDALLAQLPPGKRIDWLPLSVPPNTAATVWLDRDAADEQLDDSYFVNPYDGALLGSRRWGDISQGRANLMPFIYRLHYSLALDDVGSTILGIAALLWTLDCFVGAYLTFPRTRTQQPKRAWLRRWWPAWVVRAGSSLALFFTWHRASGLWLWGMLLVFAWSSIAMNLGVVYEPVMRTLLTAVPAVHDTLPQLREPRTQPKLGYAQALERGRELMAREAARVGFQTIEASGIGYSAARGTYVYVVRSSLDISRAFPETSVWLDGDNGRLVAFEAPTGQASANTVTTWLETLHFGSLAIGGLPYRIFVSFVGLATFALSATGVWIWWRNRKRAALRSA